MSIQKNKKPVDKASQIKTLKKVLHYIKDYRWLLIGSILFAAVVCVLTLWLPILQGQAIDKIVSKGNVDFKGLVHILMIIVVTVLITALAQWLQNLVNNKVAYHVVRDLRNAAFKKIEQLPLSYLDAHPSGDLVSRVIADADQFSDGLLMGFTQLFSGVLMILGTLIFMFSIDWIIALVVVILTPLSLFVARFIASHSYKHFRRQSEIRGQQTALIDEMISGQKAVQTL